MVPDAQRLGQVCLLVRPLMAPTRLTASLSLGVLTDDTGTPTSWLTAVIEDFEIPGELEQPARTLRARVATHTVHRIPGQ